MDPWRGRAVLASRPGLMNLFVLDVGRDRGLGSLPAGGEALEVLKDNTLATCVAGQEVYDTTRRVWSRLLGGW